MKKESEAMSVEQWIETLDKSVHKDMHYDDESEVRGRITHESFSDYEILKHALEDQWEDHDNDAEACYTHKWREWNVRKGIMALHGDVMAFDYVDSFRYRTRELALLKRWMVQAGVPIPDGMGNVDPTPPPVWVLRHHDLVEIFGDELGRMCDRIYDNALAEVSNELVDNSQWSGRDDYDVRSLAAQLLDHVATHETEALIEDHPDRRVNVRRKGKWE